MHLRMELFTNELEKTVQFYQEIIGLKLNRMNDTYAALSNDTVQIGIGPFDFLPDTHPLKARDLERLGIGVEIVIEVPDIEKKYNEIVESGYPVEAPLSEQAWGSKDFRVLDPNGYYIRITQA
ncbi:glyoxalase/bleomycin resistance/extradiol dioxygenase family protein [Bacillus sp. FJAT-29814]|uniref:VOC family protein n=1 Tax=Bacillus sp. FJAT-29814 TaxID=1729688 RepID=UPI00082B9194|nr:VOC family protein [Bacillus sp. FJAT-29814]